MTKVFTGQKPQILLFVLLVIIISFLIFWRAFSFDFWGEDWEQIWFAVFDPAMINNAREMQHPIVIYEELILARVFEFNTFYWQGVGFLLKVLSAMAVSIMMLGLTNSKKAAFLTGLIYASSVGGLVSFTWVAAHSSALVIPFLCLGIYFWVIRRNLIIAVLLLLFSTWADPARSIFGNFIVIFWEILSVLQNPGLLRESIKRVVILSAALIILYLALQYFFYSGDYAGNVSVTYGISIVFQNLFRSLDNFLTNIGNLLIGWIIPINQNIFAISTNNIYGKIAGYLFLIQTIFLLFKFYKTKGEFFKIMLVFSLWIPIFFFPNWLLANQEMIQNGQVLGMTHRYLTLSAVGLVCFLGYLLFKVKSKLIQVLVLILIVGSNILMSNQVLEAQSKYRSVSVTRRFWNQIENEVPKGERDSIFLFRGDDKTIVNDLTQAKIPFAMRREIKSRLQWPASTSDSGVVRRYLCGKNELNRVIPLSHLHGWNTKSGELENISMQIREEFQNPDCTNF